MTKVSIIVPVYNTEKYLRRCLDSLVNQTMKEVEIIIINDCSTDHSIDIINEYQREHKNIKFINNKKNMGIGYNRNIGIEKAKGEYICFIDSDDWVNETMCDKMYMKAKEDDLDLVICNYVRVLESGDGIVYLDADYHVEDFESTTLSEKPDLILNVNLAPWNKLYKKELFKNIKFPENLKYEDAIVVISAMTDSKKIGIVPENLNYYLIRNKGETGVVDERVFDILTITKMIVSKLKEKLYYDDISLYVEAMVVRNLFRYTLQQRSQKQKELKNKFIDDVFQYINDEFPNWRENKIWKKRSILKRTIESNKLLTKIYISI